MKKGLRIMLYFVGLLWFLVLVGVFSVAYCNEPAGMNLVVGVAPLALIGSVSVLIEWRVTKDE